MDDPGSGPLKIAAQVVGLAAGVVGAIYVCGGVVLGLRLTIAGLPIESILGQLPRDFVISVGLAQVVLPSLGIGAAYVGYRLLRGDNASPPKWPRWSEANRHDRVSLSATALGLTAVLIAPGVVLPIVQE